MGNRNGRYLLLIFVISAALSWGLLGCDQTDGKKYIGLVYHKVPQGLTETGGWVIDLENSYAISQISSGKTRMLWLEKLSRTGKKVTSNQVLDVLVLPKIDKGMILVGGMYMIKFQNRYDPTLIAIAQYEEKEFLTKVKYAWRVNLKTKKISPIEPKGLVCNNVSWGI